MNFIRVVVSLIMTVLTPLFGLFNSLKAPADPGSFITPAPAVKEERSQEEYIMSENDIILNGSGLEEAIEAAAGTDEETTILLKGGEYRLSGTVELKNAKNIKIIAAPGEKASITAGSEIGGFKEVTVNGIKAFCADVPDGTDFTTLFKDDEKLPVTRYPEKGYLLVKDNDRENALFTAETSPWSLTYGDTSFFAGSDFALSSPKNLTDIRIKLMHYWFCENTTLKAIDGSRIFISAPCSMEIRQNDRYFLENVFEELNAPGEWYLDKAENKLYYVPQPGDDASSLKLFAPSESKLFDISDCTGIEFNGVEFKNTDWRYSTPTPEVGWLGNYGLLFPQGNLECEGAVEITRCEGVTLTCCDFTNIGNTAVRFHRNVKSSAVKSCVFREIGCNAVFIDGEVTAEKSNLTENITVTDNYISGYGRNFPSAIGILLTNAQNCELTHNEISDGYYTAISVGWNWGYTPNTTDGIKIDYNLIYNIGQGWLSDMGGIYTLGIQPHTEIKGNRIFNVAADPGEGGYGGWGIYLDEGSSYITVQNNLVYDCGSQSFHQHYGENNLIQNNIFALSKSGQVRSSRKEDHNQLNLKGNIILTNGQPVYTNTESGKFIDDNNLYWDLKAGANVVSSTDESMNLKSKIYPSVAKKMGYYNNAVFEDPMFKDPEGFDFAISENSPAIKEIGFKPWNYNEAGTLSDYDEYKPAESTVQIPNPFITCKTFDEAAKIAGFTAAFPETVNGDGIRLIQAVKSNMIQAFYGGKHGGTLVRKAAGSGDKSGDYNNYKNIKTETVNGIKITLKGNGDKISLAVWNAGDFAYSISFDTPVAESTALSTAESIS